MTVSSTTVKNSYSGDGSNDTFVYGFKIFASSDLQVIIRSATGTETTKTLTTDYTVTGVGTASGGNVVFESTAIPTATETVVLIRNVPQTQAIDYIANDPFPAETHEEGLDRATMTIQQMQEEINRSIKLSKTNTMTSTEFAIAAADRANKVLAFDSTGEISVTQELGTYKGTDTTVTTVAYIVRDIVKSTSAAELNNVYICVGDSVVGDLLTDTDHFDLLVDAVSAAASATAAASSATDAETAQTAAETAQTAAELAETNAATSESNAATSASAAAASADAFDDVYLGSKSSDPTTDNDGDPLAAGMLYYNTVSTIMRIYSGSAWENVAVSTAGFTTLTGVETLTNKTLTAPKIANGGFVADANGNEQIKFTTTASAINELTVVNSAAGNAPEISSTGGDTNIDLKITPKGSGKIVLDGISFPNTDGTANQALVTDGSGTLSFASVTGRTGTVDWCTTAKTAPFAGVSGNGYFVNTTCGAVTVTLPATPSAGDIISIADYASTFQTNNLTICNNSSKINGTCNNASLSTEGQSITLVYVDATRGWKNTMDSTSNVTATPNFIVATGGTISCCGDYKIHTFTSDGTFTICSAPTPANNNVDYLVVAGGGGGGANRSGGGGAGGFRESSGAASGCYSVSPLGACVAAIPVTATTYPITVGAGGSAGIASPTTKGGTGSNSIFSTITSAGGGGGGTQGSPTTTPGEAGGSGGGAGPGANGGAGNTPPTSPPQGSSGGDAPTPSTPPLNSTAGGGGATAAGQNAQPTVGGAGGTGATTSISTSPTSYSGGGGAGGSGNGPCAGGAGGTGGGGNGGSNPTAPGPNPANTGIAGTVNTGGGGGGGAESPTGPPTPNNDGAAGGSGIVIIRYKYQ
jgi:hypothetical protein